MVDRELDSLVRLLDDPDPTVREAVFGRLTELGTLATLQLRDIIDGKGELQYDSELHIAAQDALSEIGMRRMLDGLRLVSESGAGKEDDDDFDLEGATLAVAMHRYPDLDAMAYRSKLDTMAELLRWRTRESNLGMEAIREFRIYLVRQQLWKGVSQNKYQDPENSCLNSVIDRRRGIPVTMTVVWLLLAQRLGLPLHGVSFPVHFLARYKSEDEDFLIDPFNDGVVVTEEQCKTFLQSIGVEFHPGFLEPVGGRHIVARMLRNLAEIYQESEPRLALGMEEGIRILAEGE
ncbi:MAG: transglutaminase family protein [Candidatus Kapaibacterium sp.]